MQSTTLSNGKMFFLSARYHDFGIQVDSSFSLSFKLLALHYSSSVDGSLIHDFVPHSFPFHSHVFFIPPK